MAFFVPVWLSVGSVLAHVKTQVPAEAWEPEPVRMKLGFATEFCLSHMKGVSAGFLCLQGLGPLSFKTHPTSS